MADHVLTVVLEEILPTGNVVKFCNTATNRIIGFTAEPEPPQVTH